MTRTRFQFVMASALSMAMPPDRWIPVGDGSAAYRDYLDQESIKRDGNKVMLWTRRDYVGQQRTVWNEIEVDCLRKRDAVLAYVQNDAGTVSHNIVRPHRGSAAIPPNSVEEEIFNLVCR